MKKILLIFASTFLFVSCKQHVLSDSFIYFSESQPVNVDEVTSFPKKYIGTYTMDYSHQIEIQSKMVLLKQIETIEATKSELDSLPGIQFKNNQIYDVERKIACKTFVKNDTIQWEMVNTDTLFSFAENEVAKIYKSSLILNKEIEGNFQVNILKFNSLGVTEVQLGTENDASFIHNELQIPRDVIIENSDTIRVVLTPSRADFRKLLRLDNFEFQNQYRFH